MRENWKIIIITRIDFWKRQDFYFRWESGSSQEMLELFDLKWKTEKWKNERGTLIRRWTALWEKKLLQEIRNWLVGNFVGIFQSLLISDGKQLFQRWCTFLDGDRVELIHIFFRSKNPVFDWISLCFSPLQIKLSLYSNYQKGLAVSLMSNELKLQFRSFRGPLFQKKGKCTPRKMSILHYNVISVMHV